MKFKLSKLSSGILTLRLPMGHMCPMKENTGTNGTKTILELRGCCPTGSEVNT